MKEDCIGRGARARDQLFSKCLATFKSKNKRNKTVWACARNNLFQNEIKIPTGATRTPRGNKMPRGKSGSLGHSPARRA